MNVGDLRRLCTERGLMVLGEPDRGLDAPPALLVKARTDNHKLRDLPAGVRIRPSGSATTIVEAGQPA